MKKSYELDILIIKTLILILIVLAIILFVFPQKKLVSDSYKSYNKDVINKINNEDLIIQKFTTKKNYKGIGIIFATYGEILKKGNIVINLYDADFKKLKKVEIDASTLRDNKIYYFDCILKKRKNYTLKINTVNINKPIAIYTTEAEEKKSSLSVNGIEKKQNILLSFIYKKSDYFSIWYCLLGISLLLPFLVCLEGKEKKYEK